MVVCFIFVQSSIMMGSQSAIIIGSPSAQKSVRRQSEPKPSSVAPQGMPIPQKNLNGLTPKKSPQNNSPYEFSPTESLGTVYYVFGTFATEEDFSPVDKKYQK